MIDDIAAAWTALRTASEAVKSVLGTVKDVETKQAIAGIQDSLLEVQSKLLTAQADYQALSEVKHELQQKLVQYEQWDAEASRYELTKLAAGIFVYVLKGTNPHSEDSHWLCPNCFDQRQKSMLQRPGVDYLNYNCHRCGFNVVPTTMHRNTGDEFDIPREPWDNL